MVEVHSLRKRKDEDQGFTLVELLVVIIIIGILAAIAVPIYRNQQATARDAATITDVRNAANVIETLRAGDSTADFFAVSDTALPLASGGGSGGRVTAALLNSLPTETYVTDVNGDGFLTVHVGSSAANSKSIPLSVSEGTHIGIYPHQGSYIVAGSNPNGAQYSVTGTAFPSSADDALVADGVVLYDPSRGGIITSDNQANGTPPVSSPTPTPSPSASEPSPSPSPESPPTDDSNVFKVTFNTSAPGCTTGPTLPFAGTVDVHINWGDGAEETTTTRTPRHNYATKGTYTATATGTFTQTTTVTSSAASCLISVDQWGNGTNTVYANYAFANARNLVSVPALPKTVVEIAGMFSHATSFNGDISNWDVSQVTSAYSLFYQATAFNQDIGGWDTSSIKTANDMFYGADSFNQDISGWDVSKVRSFSNMFRGADSFNQDIGGWDVSGAINTSNMFNGATSFNQSLNTWNMSRINDISGMFQGATSFNSPIGAWDTSSVRNASGLFYGASAFNQNIGNWNVLDVENMSRMFMTALAFNQDISKWRTDSALNMMEMFHGARSFNQDIGDWDTRRVTNMQRMFHSAYAMSADLSRWNVSKVPAANSIYFNTNAPLLTKIPAFV